MSLINKLFLQIINPGSIHKNTISLFYCYQTPFDDIKDEKLWTNIIYEYIYIGDSYRK